MNNPSDIQAVGNEVATVLLQRLAAQAHATDDPEGRNLSIRVARLEATVESILMTLRDFREDFRDFKKYVEDRFGKADDKSSAIQASMDEKFLAMQSAIYQSRKDSRQEFHILLGLWLSSVGALLGVMAKGFHWL